MTSAITLNEQLQIEAAFQDPTAAIDAQASAAIERTISALDCGRLFVVEKKGSDFQVNEWVKKAILLYFRIRKLSVLEAGDFRFVDKMPIKKWTGSEGVRVVPQAMVREGSYIAAGAVLMPSFVNVGAFVGAGTMVDTWATVGSCAYIGAGVHLSGGVGIGGVLEPIQARPVIIEDGAFIGSRAILVEGVHVEEGAVIGAGVTITSSTKIIDVTGDAPITHLGRVPKNSVVVPGTLQKNFPAGTYGVACALIIGRRKASTNLKTSLNDVLREFEIAT